MRVVVFWKIIAEYSKQMNESPFSSLETEVEVDLRRAVKSQKYCPLYLPLQTISFQDQNRKTHKKEMPPARIGLEENQSLRR